MAYRTFHFQRKPLILVGPSGVGKGTIVSLLLKHSQFRKSISHTTRKPRPGEQNGREYHFMTDPQEMKHKIDHGGFFLEYAHVHGNWYGTSFSSIQEVEREGKISLMELDVHGLRQVIACTNQGRGVYKVGILPPDLQTLEERLRGRGTESEEHVKKRLDAAKKEIRAIREDGIVDAIIENSNSWDHGYPTLLKLVHNWYPETFPKA
jgi:guanylate kinase